MQLKHNTTFPALFQIWRAGRIEPQPYIGGDSTTKKGEQILFCFPERWRDIPGREVRILLPEGTPFRHGIMWTPYVHGGFTFDPECHVLCSVPLDQCRVERLAEVPTFKGFVHTLWSWDETLKELAERAWHGEFDEECGEAQEVRRFLAWLETIPQSEESFDRDLRVWEEWPEEVIAETRDLPKAITDVSPCGREPSEFERCAWAL